MPTTMLRPFAHLVPVLAGVAIVTASVFADGTKGTAVYKARSGPVTVTFTHAYLMKGPEIGGGNTIRRVVLATSDISAALKACQSMMCSDGGIDQGMTVDFDAGPRLNYWFVANGQLIQYSGTAGKDSATLTADAPDRVAGTLVFDAQGAGGPKVDVRFDARLVKELKK